MSAGVKRVQRALISVSNKTGVAEFARGLSELGIEIISTGGTAKLLKGAGLPVRSVSEVAGFPEILDGRVKTLQPGIHGGILAVRDNPVHMAQLEAHKIEPIDLVVVNLYPFRETVAKPGVTLEEAIENIDIGGPTMVRAAAKNHHDVGIIVSPGRYEAVLRELKEEGGLTADTRFELAVEAFTHTAEYDTAISSWLRDRSAFPAVFSLSLEKVQDLRYGENPHQKAAFYRLPGAGAPSVALARQLHGKELSFNNINDADAALGLVTEFTRPAAVAVKHTNPCGVATGTDLLQAYQAAFRCDPVSIFGGIVAFNRTVGADAAAELAKIFLEIVIAPAFTPEALEILKKKKDLRLLETGEWSETGTGLSSGAAEFDLKKVRGGLLVQDPDLLGAQDREAWKPVTKAVPSAEVMDDLELAWLVVKHTKSNAIVLAKNGATVGIGTGQTNRIDAARQAMARAALVEGNPEGARGAVLASDAFFPFPDVVETAGEAGIRAIVQPGGSIRDKDSIEAADRLGLAMVFTGHRHFKH